jgi:hypothetical protein
MDKYELRFFNLTKILANKDTYLVPANASSNLNQLITSVKVEIPSVKLWR